MLTFKQAIIRHAFLKEVVAKVAGAQLHAVEGAWQAICGQPDNGSAMASAARLTIPLDYIPLMRTADGIPAAFLVACLVEAFSQKGPSDAELSDPLPCSQLVASAFVAFEARRKLADTVEEGFGCGGANAWNMLRKCSDESHAAMQRMQAIAKLAGRMFKAMAYDGIPRESKDPQYVAGVAQGDEVTRMLSEEVAMLSVDGANADVLARLEEHQVLQYDMTGTTFSSRGPLVLVLDESGSMHYQRQVWSKACAVALARIACTEGRKVRVVRYSDATRVLDVDINDADSMKELAWGHLGGNTQTTTALSVGIEQVGNLELDGFSGADIVIVTDGVDTVERRVLERMKQTGIKLWTVSIDVDLRQQSGSSCLADYASAYTHINDAALGTTGVDALANFKGAALNNGGN